MSVCSPNHDSMLPNALLEEGRLPAGATQDAARTWNGTSMSQQQREASGAQRADAQPTAPKRQRTSRIQTP